ncbi:MAG: tRNA 5-methylaminomethyl-2-thiouridine biosynthesis bifunctional protein MnmC [Chlamydiae bacterium]|nr:tRNA 5-methylaminomethyl-2-thiouridine biosynthesis bifunctional protein MnmC [Chlamydiota bacterium]
MKIAIIGAGFAGLATAYFLLESEGIQVSIFEAHKVGGGASGVASGLLHPYPGIMARRSHRGEEALAITKQLLRVAEAHTSKCVAIHRGILRQSLTEEQYIRLCEHCDVWGDIEKIGEDLFLIHSGITVLSENYLEGLHRAVSEKGGELIIQKIETLDELKSFDHIVIAAGYGMRTFAECQHLNVKFLKGQALQMEGTPPHDRSFISKGYLAHLGSEKHFEIGSTYEREFQSDAPDLEIAKKMLGCPEGEIIRCKAGVRVCNRSHYLPIIEQVADNAHVFTALGSRGLLYHGLYGRILAQRIQSITCKEHFYF